MDVMSESCGENGYEGKRRRRRRQAEVFSPPLFRNTVGANETKPRELFLAFLNAISCMFEMPLQ